MSPAAEHVLKLAMELPIYEQWSLMVALSPSPPPAAPPAGEPYRPAVGATDERAVAYRAEVSRLGRGAYAVIKATKLTPADDNKYVVVDVDSGDYEIDASSVEASRRLRERRPHARGWLERTGHPTAFKMRSPGRLQR